jgi:hypothetical protein
MCLSIHHRSKRLIDTWRRGRRHSQIDLLWRFGHLWFVVLGRLVPLHGVGKVLVNSITDFLGLSLSKVDPAWSSRLSHQNSSTTAR